MYAGFAETPPTREELGAAIATGGLAGSCWDLPDLPDLPDLDDLDDPDREETEAALARAREAAARYAAHYGLDTPKPWTTWSPSWLPPAFCSRPPAPPAPC
ncbi:hypothetical protein [Kitasatospora sp. NPDC093679]|uniref:hypothetical protein n=1 Tax=Kitasatospora sp. NPDC093679 TaxID=3154983 RepID=UPI003443F57A